MSIEYTTRDGEKVFVPISMDPFKQLGIPCSASVKDTKHAVWLEVRKPSRQDRAMASLAYHMITSKGNQYQKEGTMYQLQSADIFFYAVIGHRDKVIAEIERDTQLVKSVDDHQRTVLYLAARCGFSDIVETLVCKGADLNHRQCDNSTPLHVAAFYGQKEVVEILLAYGADPTLKNVHEHTPVVEASEELRSIFTAYESNPFQSTVFFFSSTNLTDREENISYQEKSIGVEVFRSMNQLDDLTKSKWSDIKKHWKVAFHGTKDRNIKSILTHGLLPSGAKLPNGEMIKPPSNHIPLEASYAGKKEWAKAIFVSPSLMYASNIAYTDHVCRGNSKWCVVIKVYVKPLSYDRHGSTLAVKDEDELSNNEYRVEKKIPNQTNSNVIEFYRNVVVASVIFMDLDFRQHVKDIRLHFEKLRELFK